MWPRWTPQPVLVVVLTLVAAVAAAAAASARLLAPPSAAAAAVAQARADQPSKGTPKWQLRAAIFFSQPVRIRDGANHKKLKSRGAQQPSRQHHRCQGWMDFWWPDRLVALGAFAFGQQPHLCGRHLGAVGGLAVARGRVGLAASG